jgi:hypothetical protein
VAEDIGHLFFVVFTSMCGIFALKLLELLGKVTTINWHMAEGPK